MQKGLLSILKWSEKYTKTDMVYIAKGGFWLVFGQILTFIFSFILTWVFANWVSKEIYGTYKFAISIFGLLSITTLSGMGVSIAKSVAQNKSGSVKKSITKKINWGFLGMIGGIILALYYYINQNLELAIIFASISILVPFTETFADYQFYLQGQKDFKSQSIYRTIQRAVLALLTILVIIISNDVKIIIFSYLLFFGLLNFLIYKKSLKKYPPNQEEDANLIPYGYHLSLMGVLRLIANQIDKILMFHFVGAIALANYFFAIAVPQEMNSLFSQMNTLAFPKFSDRNDSHSKKALLIKICKYSGILILPVGLYIILAPLFFQIFFPEYMAAVFYSQIFVLSLLFTPFTLINNFFSATGRTKILYFTNLIEPILFIIFLLILLPTLGILGAILSVILKVLINSAVLTGLLIRDIKNSL